MKLLSFGADEDGEEEDTTFKKKPIYRPERKFMFLPLDQILISSRSGGKHEEVCSDSRFRFSTQLEFSVQVISPVRKSEEGKGA